MSVTKEAVANVLDGVIARHANEVANLQQADLENYWHFSWDETSSLEVNIYRFHSRLGLYASICRRWEETHKGSSCVVERVRDTYLMPKIREFAARLLTPNAGIQPPAERHG